MFRIAVTKALYAGSMRNITAVSELMSQNG